jgi:hexosaminidase
MAHPEIREREGDAYPDTYCPNHPDTYPLVFDVLEEVIEVFEPKVINITAQIEDNIAIEDVVLKRTSRYYERKVPIALSPTLSRRGLRAPPVIA